MKAFESRLVLLPIRILQGIFALIVLGTAAYPVSWWLHYWHISAPGSLDFLLFCAVWTLLALIYLIVVPWHFSETRAHHHYAILAVEAITMIFWFAGFIAVAVFLTGRGCGGSVCKSAQAATVFGAFEWILFAITTALAAMYVFRSHRGHSVEDKLDHSHIRAHDGV